MTKDEALKLALEALEGYVNVVVSVNDPNEWTPKVADAGEPARKAITAIKEALAQPEQEPFMASYQFKQYGYYKDGKGTLKLGNIPATQPPQRTWVGLTDEEIIEMLNYGKYGHVPQYVRNFVDAIEAKLKEKNT